mmetsp:Transcript_75384/g.243872  ORF Transcript_75384/g.243872 Transcript_75384/m.243872 type:complete len:245 (-) Transcript_75384:45-779(-)
MVSGAAEHRFLEKLPAHMRKLILSHYEDEDLEVLRRTVLGRRDSAIIGCMIEIGVSVAAIGLYDIRRSLLLPIVNVGLTILSSFGLRGAMYLSLGQIQVHGIVTSGLIIAWLLNILAEAFLTHTGVGSDTLPGWLVLAIIFVPYSLNLGCSALSLCLGSALLEFLELEEERGGFLSESAIEQQAQGAAGRDTCCVCMEARKDAVITPCGHRAVCCRCGDELKDRGRRCPLCRKHIENIIRVYDS